MAPYITKQWWRVAVIPSKKTAEAGEVVSLRDAVEQYTRSEKSIKEIVCQKQLVGWNFGELQMKLRALIYSTGYRNHIKIVSYIFSDFLILFKSWALRRFLSKIIEYQLVHHHNLVVFQTQH